MDNNQLKVTTSTTIIFKNIKGKNNYYQPSPVFENEYERDTFKNVVFNINKDNCLDKIRAVKIDNQSSKYSKQMKYMIKNKIDYSSYTDLNEIYIKHKTEYFRQNENFFQFYQFKYPCRSTKVICNLLNKTENYSIICSASSHIGHNIQKFSREKIEKQNNVGEIVFENWSDIRFGFTVTLSKK